MLINSKSGKQTCTWSDQFWPTNTQIRGEDRSAQQEATIQHWFIYLIFPMKTHACIWLVCRLSQPKHTAATATAAQTRSFQSSVLPTLKSLRRRWGGGRRRTRIRRERQRTGSTWKTKRRRKQRQRSRRRGVRSTGRPQRITLTFSPPPHWSTRGNIGWMRSGLACWQHLKVKG